MDGHLPVRRLQIENTSRKLNGTDDQGAEADRPHTRPLRIVQRPVADSYSNDSLDGRPVRVLRVLSRIPNERV